MVTLFSFYSVLSVNFLAVFASIVLEKFNKKKASELVFPLLAFVDVFFSFLVFIGADGNLQTAVFQLLFKENFYLTYGFIVDKASVTYLLILAIIYFCVFVFCYSFSIVGTSKNAIFSILSSQIFFLKIAILATGFFQLILGMDLALLFAGILIVNGRRQDESKDSLLSFMVFETIGSFLIFVAFAIWLSTFGNDGFVQDNNFENKKELINIVSSLLWLFVWVKGGFIIGNLVFIKTSRAHFPSFIVTATITVPLCFMIVMTRLSDVLLFNPKIVEIAMILGVATVFLSPIFAVFEKDIASSLAFLISSQMGLMITYFVLNGLDGFVFFAVFQITASLLYFLACGSLIEAFSSEYRLDKMGGAKKLLPATYFMMLVGAAFMLVPYLSIKIVKIDYMINVWELLASGVFAFAVARIIICSCLGTTKAEDAVFARVQERSLFILSSMSVTAIFLSIVSYYIKFNMFSGYRLIAVAVGIFWAEKIYRRNICSKEVRFSFAEKADMFFFKVVAFPMFRFGIALKNKVNNRILNRTIEKIIDKMFELLKKFAKLYQKNNFTFNALFFAVTLILTLSFVVFYK
ncbi:MAG: proton-conducting transporter membrane subunit [Alphaproteobacteria bacterium]